MAKFPKWQANYTPSPGGPVISAQPNAGQAGAALAGMGANVARVGVYLTREAKEAAEKTAELDRIRQSSTVTRQATRELRKFSDEIRRDPNPANYERRFEEVSQSILAGLDEIEDPEVRTRAQVKIDQELDFHHRDMLTWRMEAQQKAFEREYLQAEQDAVRTGNMEALQEPLQGLVEAGFIDESQADRSWQVTEAKAQIWQTALAKGWKEGLKYATDPETMANLPLSAEERQAFKSELESYLRTEETLAELQRRKQEDQDEQARNTLFADAMSDQLNDPAQIEQALRDGILTPPEAGQLYRLLSTGPAEVNDVDTLIAARKMIDGIERGDTTSNQAINFLRKSASKLTPGTFSSLVSDATDSWTFQARAATHTRSYALTQLIPIEENVWQMLQSLQLGKDVMGPLENDRARGYRLVQMVETQLRQWITDHPEATYAEAAEEGRRLVDEVRLADRPQQEAWLDAWSQSDRDLQTYDMDTRQLTPASAPLGLEDLWYVWDDEARDEALSLLTNGWTASEIRRFYRPQEE